MEKPLFPIEVEVRIEPDGSVIFADLEQGMLPVRAALAAEDNSSTFCAVPQKPEKEQ